MAENFISCVNKFVLNKSHSFRLKELSAQRSDPSAKDIIHQIIGTLNINSVSSKFDQMFASGKVDILDLIESKLDSSFPTNQFLIEGYSKPFRFDRNRNGRG